MYHVDVYSLAAEGNNKVSEHFKVREFRCKDGSDVVLICPRLVEVLEAIRTHFGAAVTVNSGYRTVSHNNATPDSSPKSQHMYGTAADIVVKGHTAAEVYAYAETLLPGTGGLGNYGSFTHVDVRPDKSRWRG